MFNHYSVMLNESIDMLDIKPDGIYIDMTLGGCGHAKEILKRLNENGRLIGFDQDITAINNAKLSFDQDTRVTVIQSNFVNFKSKLSELNISKVDGVIFDLGVSSVQLDEVERGFSYRFEAKLDMRMDQAKEVSAYEVVNNYSFNDLYYIIKKYGEDKFAKQIARNIEKERLNAPIVTTYDLVDIVKKSKPQSELRKKGHPAKQTFQAIRIEVNNELDVFKKALEDCCDMLSVEGRVVVITFHSLEDRICKRHFNSIASSSIPKGVPAMDNNIKFKVINKKVIIPTDNELDENLRSKSSKLRVIERVKD